MVNLRLSKSKLLTYKQCPRKYYFDSLVFTYKPQTEEREYLVTGTLLHEYFEAYNKKDPDIDRYTRYLMGEPEYAKHVVNFHKILEKNDLDRAKFSELKIYDQEMDFVGVIDAVYETDLGYTLVDYKTGKYHKNKKSDMILELSLYVNLVEKNLGIEINRFGMFFTKEPENSFIQTVTEKNKEKAVDSYITFRNSIECCEFQRKPTKLCNWCDHYAICDEYKDQIIQD